MSETTHQAIAIVGMAGRFPDARTLDDFWSNIRNGVESLRDHTDAELEAAGVPRALRNDPAYVRRGTTLDEAEYFDAAFFGLSPREAQTLDPQQRIFLECAWHALEDAGYGAGAEHESVGVYAGVGFNTYLLAQMLKNKAFAEAVGGYQIMVGNDKDFLCTRASYKMNLRGPSVTVQTACSTSLVAVEMACKALQRGECDMALAGGVSVAFPQSSGYLFQEGMILSPDGHCRPFDIQAKGTRPGAGAGIVVLKLLAHAIRDRDHIRAVIRGAAINNDGAGKAGYTAPSIDGQVEVIAMAQALAGVDARDISYVEAHGTATPLGDPIEIAALTQVFSASTPDRAFCRLGSLKANLGHLDAAAGVAGLMKTVLALEHRWIPPLVNFTVPNPALELDSSPFLTSAQGTAWDAPAPRLAGVSSFGIGGTNAHVIVEEAPAASVTVDARPARLLVLSAKTAGALERVTVDLKTHLEANPQLDLADVEWTLQVGRKDFVHRRAIPVTSRDAALAALANANRAPAINGEHSGGARAVVFSFSGQGSQYPGMTAELYRYEPVYRGEVDRCAGILQPIIGRDIREILFSAASDGIINQTQFTQPALFVCEYALAWQWIKWGVAPAAMIGHSIGEYVAAQLAGVFSLEDALRAVAERGRLMQSMPPGQMAAVPLPATELASLIGSSVEIAAMNAPSMCTVSGDYAAIENLVKTLQTRGVEARVLHTSHAFHSTSMEGAMEPMRQCLSRMKLSPPRIPYLSNVTGTWIKPEQATSTDYYAQHLRGAVRFEAGIAAASADPSRIILEVGPGSALTALARMCFAKDAAKRAVSSLAHVRDKRGDIESILDCAGRLWASGVPIDWRAMHIERQPRRIPLPLYPFERKRYHIEPAHAPASWDKRAASSESSSGTKEGRSVDLRSSTDLNEWFYAPTWIRDEAAHLAGARISGSWLVSGPDTDLARRITERLKAAGVDAFCAADRRKEDVPLDGVIDLAGLGGGSEASAADRYRHLSGLATGLWERIEARPVRILCVTQGAQSVLSEPISNVSAAGALGPALVLPAEMQGLRVRLIDLPLTESADALTQCVCAEVAAADNENIVAWRMGRRWMRRFESIPLPSPERQDLPLKAGGVYWITGGTGGIGLTVASWLARMERVKILLTSRSALIDRARWDEWIERNPADPKTATIRAVREIEASGSEVDVLAADASDGIAMAAARDAALRRWNRIDGVIHAAGVAGSGAISVLKKPGEESDVFASKAGGLHVLTDVLSEQPLDFVCLMSSINSTIGLPGSSDYSSANAVLDSFVDSSERPQTWRYVTSINWDAWCDVGMAANLSVPSARRGRPPEVLESVITAEKGAEALARVLASRRSHVVVAAFDLALAVDVSLGKKRMPFSGPAPRSDAPPAQNSRAGSESPSGVDTPPRAGIAPTLLSPAQARLAAIWQELLGVDNVGLDEDFFELGGHSLLATRVLARVKESLGATLALRDIFDAPTIRTLCERLDTVSGGEGVAPAAGTPAGARTTGAAAPIAAEEREELEF